jgi:hypothetical protein
MSFHNCPELLFFIAIRDLCVSAIHVPAWYQSSLFFRKKKKTQFLIKFYLRFTKLCLHYADLESPIEE